MNARFGTYLAALSSPAGDWERKSHTQSIEGHGQGRRVAAPVVEMLRLGEPVVDLGLVQIEIRPKLFEGGSLHSFDCPIEMACSGADRGFEDCLSPDEISVRLPCRTSKTSPGLPNSSGNSSARSTKRRLGQRPGANSTNTSMSRAGPKWSCNAGHKTARLTIPLARQNSVRRPRGLCASLFTLSTHSNNRPKRLWDANGKRPTASAPAARWRWVGTA